jgi:ribosome maturation factor RimP
MSSDVETRITEWFAAQPGFEAFELAGLTVRRHGKRSFVEVLLDRQDGRITLDECGRWNRALSQHLEETDLFAGPYLVEISSPGVDRPLTMPRHYARALGRKLKVHYQDPSGALREFTGRLERADENGISLRSDEQALDLPYAQVQQARQEVTFSKETN